MAEENTTTPEQEKEATEQAEPSFQMVRAFFKDASLEMPHAPDIFFEDHDEQPTVDFKFGVAARPLAVKDLYEVCLLYTSPSPRDTR